MSSSYQRTVREESEEIDQYIKDLQAWEVEAKKLDADMISKPKKSRDSLPQPRNRVSFLADPGGAGTSASAIPPPPPAKTWPKKPP